MSKEKQADWTEEAEWTKAPPVRTAEDDHANELLQAGFMMGLLGTTLKAMPGGTGRVVARVFLHALRPGVAALIVEKWDGQPEYLKEEFARISTHDQLPIT